MYVHSLLKMCSWNTSLNALKQLKSAVEMLMRKETELAVKRKGWKSECVCCLSKFEYILYELWKLWG